VSGFFADLPAGRQVFLQQVFLRSGGKNLGIPASCRDENERACSLPAYAAMMAEK